MRMLRTKNLPAFYENWVKTCYIIELSSKDFERYITGSNSVQPERPLTVNELKDTFST